MKKDPKIFIEHIIESIEEIEKYTRDQTKSKFSKAGMMQDATIKRLEIIGEAVKNLSVDFRNRHKEIAWKKIAGMRDILTHDYFGINIDTVWKTVKNDLPELKKQILNLYEQI